MKLNKLERYVVRHPLRLWLQQHLEQRLIIGLFGDSLPVVKSALEIGCGYGSGIQLMRQGLGAEKIVALDADEQMLHHCTTRYQQQPWLTLMQADAARLPFDNGCFDLVCDFAVFHHVLDWQQACAEVFRVLRPGGVLVMEELYRTAICNPLSRRLFEHPQSNRFNHAELLQCLQNCGFEISNSRQIPALAGAVLATKPKGNSLRY